MLQQLRERVKQYFKDNDVFNATKSTVSLLKAIDIDITNKKKEIEILHSIYESRQQQLETQLPSINDKLLKGNPEDIAFMGRLKYEVLEKFERFEEDHISQLYNLHKAIEKLEFMKSLEVDDQTLSYKEWIQNPDNVVLKYKQYTKDSLGRERSSMPQVDADDIDKFLIHFSKTTKVTPCKVALSNIKPAQGEFDDEKIIDKMTNDDWKNRKYLISKDNYLIDGHHSWAGGIENDPDYEVDCYKVNLTAKELLRRTNLLKITRKEGIDGNSIKKEVAIFKGLTDIEISAFCKAHDRYLVIRENENEQLRADELWSNVLEVMSPSLKQYNRSIEQIFEKQ